MRRDMMADCVYETKQEQIPRIIHYCWFGNNPKSDLMKTCIESWKKFCPDYQIIEWNETNYDITKNPYMNEAYDAGKWAFVSDYARLDIVYQFGGVYLDVDVELIRSIDDILAYPAVMGFEDGKNVATGLICAARKKHETIRELRDVYDNLSFFDESGLPDLTPCPFYTTWFLKKKGLMQNNTFQICCDIAIFPTDYFCPFDFISGKSCISENTYAIHHAAMSWHDKKSRGRVMLERRVYKSFGRNAWRVIHGLIVWREHGFLTLIERILQMRG